MTNGNGSTISSSASDKTADNVHDNVTPTDTTEAKQDFDVNYSGKPKKFQRDFTFPTHLDEARQATPNTAPYLDDEMRRAAEIQRAKVEDRKPDLDNPPAMQGTPLIATDIAKGLAFGAGDVPVAATLPVMGGNTPEKKREVMVPASMAQVKVDGNGEAV